MVDAHATGWRVWAVSYLLFLVDDLPFFWSDRAQGWPAVDAMITSVALTTVAHLALVLVLVLARVTWLRTGVARRRASVTVWTIIVATVVSTVVESIAGSMTASDAALVSLDGIAYRSVALLIIAGSIASLAEQQRALDQLLRRRSELEQLRAEGENTISRLRDEVLQVVRGQVSVVGGDVHRAAEVIRRISHELAFTEPQLRLGQTAPMRRPSFRAVWRSVALRPLIAPGIMATVMTLLAVRSTTVSASQAAVAQQAPVEGLAVNVDVGSLGRALLMVLAVWVATYCATRLTARLLVEATHRSSGPLAWWQHALTVVGAALLAQGLAALVNLVPGFSPPPPFEAWMLGTYVGPLLVCAVVIGLVRAVDRHAALTRDAIDDVVARLQWDVATYNALARSERRSIAFLLHGTVLPSLRASLVEGMAERQAERSLTLMIDGVLSALRSGDPGRLRPLADRLDDLVLLWESVSPIILDVEESVHLATAGDPASTAAISDVVSEAVSNSVTHARPIRIVVRLRLADVDLVEITVDDTAAPVVQTGSAETAPSPGLGSRLFDDVCVLWHRFPHGEGSRFQAWIPLGASPERHDPVLP